MVNQQSLRFTNIPLAIIMPIHWAQLFVYCSLLLYKVGCKRIKIDGGMKCAIYTYIAPMLLRAITSTLLIIFTAPQYSSYYSF